MTKANIRQVALALPHPAFPSADWGDTFEVVTNRSFADAEEVARTMLGGLPGWASGLMGLRDRIVGPLGLKTGAQMQASPQRACIGIFPIVTQHPGRIILGEDDAHLDFRVAVDLIEETNGQRIALSTLVKRNNVAGKTYLAMIMPFHKLIVKAMLRTVR